MNKLYVVFNYSLMGSHTAMGSFFIPTDREPESEEDVVNLDQLICAKIADEFKTGPHCVEVVVINWRLLK